jgi:2-iminobutanoate/2-iminopropanoate deaminase
VKQKLQPVTLPRPGGPYSHGLKVSCRELVFVAGQIPVDKDGKIVGIDPSDELRYPINLETQVRQAYLNVIAVLEEAGASVRDIVRLDTYVAVSAMNEYRKIGLKLKREMLSGSEPPGATVFVNALMMTNTLIEIGAIAAID